VSLHEWHLVGADGLPVRHRTVHVLRALRPGLSSYTYRFDSREARVRAVRGCRAGAPRPDADGLMAVDLELPRSLAVGETAALEYETLFDWRSVPPPELRRGMRQRVERLDMRVEFSPLRLPARLEWAVWDGFGPDASVRAAEVCASTTSTRRTASWTPPTASPSGSPGPGRPGRSRCSLRGDPDHVRQK
jgi:hypothetical protein